VNEAHASSGTPSIRFRPMNGMGGRVMKRRRSDEAEGDLCTVVSHMSLRSFLHEPLQGKTSLGRVIWLYGVLGSILVSAVGLAVDPGNELATRVYTAFGFLFSVYVSIATYRCASNCRSKYLARLARISAVASLVMLPALAYLYFSGAIGVALVTLRGEQ